jgi:hypothetical protein
MKKSIFSVNRLNLITFKWLVLMILKSRELLTELNASLFVKPEMLVQHLLINSGSWRKFIARFDLLQTDGKNHMTTVSLIIQMLVVSLNYHKQVETPSLKRVVDKEKVAL